MHNWRHLAVRPTNFNLVTFSESVQTDRLIIIYCYEFRKLKTFQIFEADDQSFSLNSYYLLLWALYWYVQNIIQRIRLLFMVIE